jgi:hypothetical protein
VVRAAETPFQTHCYTEHLVAPGIELGTSMSAARNFDHYTTEAVCYLCTPVINAVFKTLRSLLVENSIDYYMCFFYQIWCLSTNSAACLEFSKHGRFS